jgi:hypothetical protein
VGRVTYNPLTDDILIAVESAQERARTSRQEDGTFALTHLLSGFDIHPTLAEAIVTEQVENHAGRVEAGADLKTVLTSILMNGLLVGLFLGEVREARTIAARRGAA